MQIFLFKEEGKFSISSFITFLFSFQIKKIIIQKLICIFFVNVFETKFNILVLLVLLIKSVYCTYAYDISLATIVLATKLRIKQRIVEQIRERFSDQRSWPVINLCGNTKYKNQMEIKIN